MGTVPFAWSGHDDEGNTVSGGGSIDVQDPATVLPYVGSSMQGGGDPATLETFCGRVLGVRRTYWAYSTIDSSITVAKADQLKGRIPWLSYKLSVTWDQAASGQADAATQALATKLATVPGEVWVAIHHEPEGDGDIKVWQAFQQRLLALLKAGAPNVRTSTILTAYNVFKSGNTTYDVANWWPGSMVDIMAFDAYNPWGRADGSTQWYELKTYYDVIAPAAKARGVDWAVAETGYTDAAAARTMTPPAPDWLTRAYDDMKDQPIQPGLALTYWNAVTSPSNGSWPLGTGVKRDKFKAILARAR